MSTISNRHPAAASKRRNFGIIAHVDAGKTTVSERILFFTGVTHRMGEVHDGEATMDFLEEERKRGITITAAAITCHWKEHALNLIDTPGHIDFTAEVERSLRALDGAVGVFCAVGGVEPQSETVWRQADRYGVPRLAFVNKMDRVGADFVSVGLAMRNRLNARPVAINVPLGEGPDFRGILDVVEECAWFFDPDERQGARLRREPVPPGEQERMQRWRTLLFEKLANQDEAVMEAYLAGDSGGVPLPLLKQALRRATLAGAMTPVLCGAALRNAGVRLLLDAVVDYLPAPEDYPPVEGRDPKTGEVLLRARLVNAPTTALAFKTVSEPSGDLTFLRVYSGSLDADTHLLNPRTGREHRLGRILRIHANRREGIEKAEAGDIIGVLGLKEVATGDTLCEPRAPIALEAPVFPEPVVVCAVEPAKTVDRDKLARALSRVAHEDPTFRRFADAATGETLVGGMGELHLEISLNRIRTDFKVEILTGPPQVAYRQMLGREVTIAARHIKQTGGAGQYAVAEFTFTPDASVEGLEFANEIVGGAIPKEFIPPLERGVREELALGGDLRFSIVGLVARLTDGKAHDVDSSDRAFNACGKLAVRLAIEAAGLTLLEPILKFNVIVPTGQQGAVLGDLANRRAAVEGFETRGERATIHGIVPAASMFAYNSTLLGLTQGAGIFTLEPCRFARVPESIADRVRVERRENLAAKAARRA